MKKKLESLVTNDIAWLILVTWPTGSWKTTTLYGLIRAMDPRIGILTIENPIESYIEWINQSQEDATWRQSQDDNYNLDHFLKSATRQAPKVLLVWEIRNAEAAQKCTTIGLTWHKVLATYHTKSPIW
jgi:type II secretory ATPase GspE/PulE/Tfp pilus assembly ATPase PilB-like protein